LSCTKRSRDRHARISADRVGCDRERGARITARDQHCGLCLGGSSVAAGQIHCGAAGRSGSAQSDGPRRSRSSDDGRRAYGERCKNQRRTTATVDGLVGAGNSREHRIANAFDRLRRE
jgi:hypothetical protein